MLIHTLLLQGLVTMNKLTRSKNQYGFTIIEMIIVITITSILASIGAMIFSNAMNSYFTAQRLNGLSIEAEQAMQLVSRELRSAQSISDAKTNTITFNNNNASSINYNLSATNLRRSLDGGTNYNITTHLTSFTILYFDNNLDQIATPVIDLGSVKLITVQANFAENENTIQLIQTIYLRNIL